MKGIITEIGETEDDTASASSLPKQLQLPEVSQSYARSQAAPPGLSVGSKSPRPWASLCCFSRHNSRELV